MAIIYSESVKTFYLDGKDTSYIFSVNKHGFLEHRYYGPLIPHEDLSYTSAIGTYATPSTVPGFFENRMESYHFFPSELSFFGTGDYREPTVEVINRTGDRLTELLYESHEIIAEKPHKLGGMPSMRGGETLIVHLKDKITNFAADLHYTVYDDAPVISRRIVYKNGGCAPVILKRAYSFSLALPEAKYDTLTLYGGWGKERQIERSPLTHGIYTIDSKRSSSSHTYNPFMAIVAHDTTETNGDAYGISLVYSSSFVLKAEHEPDGQVRVMGGINDFDFAWKLEHGEELVTPEVLIAYSQNGIGGMSRAYHDAFRNHLINPRFVNSSRPIVINNWEGTHFDFNLEKLKAIADGISGTGVDTFVLDDGWFGKRDDDRSGLGDWYVNEKKLPGGLDPIIKHVNSLGMKFGLWFEPEMISEDSDLFRAHPDWAIGAPNRKRCYCRFQFLLDLTRPEVRDHIVNAVNTVLINHNIEYVKWDFNRTATEFVSLGREPERQAEFSHRYALGLYDICDRIVEANPDIFFEGCASGGGRFDPAMLYYFPQIWTSDNTDINERVGIQYGTSIPYPLSAASCHVSVTAHGMQRDGQNRSKAAIAHLGPTGYELDSSLLTDEDRERIIAEINEYKTISELILKGDLYRTESPFEGNNFTETIVSKDKTRAVLTAYRRVNDFNGEIRRIKAAGLAPEKRYHSKELGLTLSGATLMNAGWVPEYPKYDFSAIVYHFEEV